MKIIVYSYCTNNTNNKPFQEILYKNDCIDYVMFTDNGEDGSFVGGWKIKKLTVNEHTVHENLNKYIKWNPFDVIDFEKYDYSIYVDSKVLITSNPLDFVGLVCGKLKYGFCTHRYDFKGGKYKNHCDNYLNIYNHIDYLIDANAGIKDEITKWKSILLDNNVCETRFSETAVIVTNLRSTIAKNIMHNIFCDYMFNQTRRDQISLPYTLERLNIDINDITILGDYSKSSNFRNNSIHNVNNRTYDTYKHIEKTHVIHWYAKNRDVLELSEVEKFHMNCLSKFKVYEKFDSCVLSISIDDVDNKELIDFIKSEFLKVYRCKNVSFDIIKNIPTDCELQTFNKNVFDKINNGGYIFYSHIKGVKYEKGDTRYVNDMYWSYLMYMGCVSNESFGEMMWEFSNGKLQFGAFKNYVLQLPQKQWNEYKKTIKNDYILKLGNKNHNKFFYAGTYQWLNCDALIDFFEKNNVDSNELSKVEITYRRTNVPEYLLGCILPDDMCCSSKMLSKFEHNIKTKLDYDCYDINVFDEFKKEFNDFRDFHRSKIVVTMTSWKKRIDGCLQTIKLINNNTLRPDNIYLNLSVEEFPNMLNDLPKELVDYSYNNNLIINWVYGKNTKVFKKVFPILEYLSNDDLIIQIDDDILYPNDCIQKMYCDFVKYNCPITTNEEVFKSYISDNYVYFTGGALSISKKSYYRNWDNFVNYEIISTYEDDHVYPIIFELNGIFYKPSSYYKRKDILNLQRKKYFGNDVIKIRDSRRTRDILKKRVDELKLKKSNETQYQTSKNIQYFGNIKEDDNYEKLVSLIKSGQLKKKSSGVWYEVESNNEFNSIESSMLDVISSIIEKQKEIEDRQKELNRLDKEQNVKMYSIHKQQESIKTDKQKIDEDKKNLELSKHQLDEDRKRLDVIKQGIKLEKKSKREQLKEDIATGKLVKVKMGNGYVWKRVR